MIVEVVIKNESFLIMENAQDWEQANKLKLAMVKIHVIVNNNGNIDNFTPLVSSTQRTYKIV